MKKENNTTWKLVKGSEIKPKVFDRELFKWIRENFVPANEPYYAMNDLDFWRLYNYERKKENLPTVSKRHFLISMDMRDFIPIEIRTYWIFYISEESPAIEKVKAMYAEKDRSVPYRYVPSKPLYKLTAEKIVDLLEEEEDHTKSSLELKESLGCSEKVWRMASKYLISKGLIFKENIDGVWFCVLLK